MLPLVLALNPVVGFFVLVLKLSVKLAMFPGTQALLMRLRIVCSNTCPFESGQGHQAGPALGEADRIGDPAGPLVFGQAVFPADLDPGVGDLPAISSA